LPARRFSFPAVSSFLPGWSASSVQWRLSKYPRGLGNMGESLEVERSKVHEAQRSKLKREGRGVARHGVSKWRYGPCKTHKVGSVRRFAVSLEPWTEAPCLAGILQWLYTFDCARSHHISSLPSGHFIKGPSYQLHMERRCERAAKVFRAYCDELRSDNNGRRR
jgi:hypothetical protein